MLGITRRAGSALIGLLGGVLATLAGPLIAAGADPENCLLCHRYPGFGRIDDAGDSVRLFYVNPEYYDRALGPHARLRCTDCHIKEEVDVIPHQAVSRVDCTKACHLTFPDKPPRIFAHEGIAEMLDTSVHTEDVLLACNDLLGSPLDDDQARCLLCHEEPTFQRPDDIWHQQVAATGRCDVCHTEELMENTRYAFWHVYARSRPARSHERLARGCALCHSNTDIRGAFQLPDSVASYLNSFHGKAMQLGSEETAACLDCHVRELENVHLITEHTDPESAVYPARLPDTCRSPACHPGAGMQFSGAAVHLELTPSNIPPPPSGVSPASQRLAGETADRSSPQQSSLTIEYLIGLGFLILIAFTFGPSAFLQTMELIQVLIGRHDAHHHRNVQLARSLMRDPAGRRRLTRFTVHQRAQHWVLFATFTALVLTGFPIKFADRDWAAWMINLFGGLSVARGIHRWAGAILMVGAVYHLIYVSAHIWRSKRLGGIPLWRAVLELPMTVNLRDLRELWHLLLYLFGVEKTRPPAGRFSLKEKFEYYGVFWGCTLLGVTGLIMWANELTSRYITGRMLTIASLIHTMEAFLALLHVGLFHMIGVILSPHVFPLSGAMLSGDTPPEELAEAHAGLITDSAEALKLTPQPGDAR